MESDMIIVQIFKNKDLLGNLEQSMHSWNMHSVTNAFIETHHQIRIPSLLCNSLSSVPGYDFTSEQAKRCSYHYFLDVTGKLSSSGSDLDMKTW